MTRYHSFAVVVTRSDRSTPMPSMDDVRQLVIASGSSISQYFRDTTENWIGMRPVDFHGPYDIARTPLDSRASVIANAKAAARADGVDPSRYDHTVVIDFPGGGDAGASNADCYLPAWTSFSFFCHEIAHLIGWSQHSFGLENTGSDWSGTGATRPVYGDPYDLMSAETYGGAEPRGDRPAGDVPTAFPSWGRHGPHLSRAMLHMVYPEALETAGKVTHLNEGGEHSNVLLAHTGAGEVGNTELIVWHPTAEDGEGRGRVYVEYRQPFADAPMSRWDSGLASSGDALDRTGVIVHVVQNHDKQPIPVVWYAGRVVVPKADADVEVATPTGPVHVAVSWPLARYGTSSPPRAVTIRITRVAREQFLVGTTHMNSRAVVSSTRRLHPGWEWAGEFTYETWRTARRTTFRPVTTGLGTGSSPRSETSDVSVSWTVGGVAVDPAGDRTTVRRWGTVTPIQLRHEVDRGTGALVLRNEPQAEPIALSVVGLAQDSQGDQLWKRVDWSVPGEEEGWGPDWQEFQQFWRRLTKHERVGLGDPPPELAKVKKELADLRRWHQRLLESRPEAAAKVEELLVVREQDLRARLG